MNEIVKKTIRVVEAKYIDEAKSILLVGDSVTGEGKIRHQIHSDCFSFGNKDVATEMKKTADLMIGKLINIEFVPKNKNKNE